jgi:asparagine synthase (glutamine-hydrolysing)
MILFGGLLRRSSFQRLAAEPPDGLGFQPTSFQHLWFAGEIVLHNTASLLQSLGLSTTCPTLLSDVEIVSHAYARWGEHCVSHLDGEFGLLVWDCQKRELFGCRDPLGAKRFYYIRDEAGFHFGSTPLDMFRASTGLVRRLNRNKLAAMAIPRGHNYFDEETFYEGVMALPPGSSIRVDQSCLHRSTWWQPEVKTKLVPRDEGEAFETLRGLLFQAVENRIRGSARPASQVSGGLDSSAVTAIAAQLLARQNQTLPAFAAVLPPNARNSFSDEREWAAEFRSFPNVDLEFVTSEGRGPFDLIHDPRNYEHTFLRTVLPYIDDALEDAALAKGADLLLDGIGGEFGVTSYADGYVLELLAGLHFGAAIKALRDIRAVTGTSPLRLVAREFLNLALPLRGRRTFLWLTDEFARECRALPIIDRHWPDHRRSQLAFLAYRRRLHASPAGHRHGTNMRYASPLLDRHIIEFCLAAPGTMKLQKGYSRYLVRGALAGVLPEKIRWRTANCEASPDYMVRYKAHIEKAREFVWAIRKNDPVRSIVDVERLKRSVLLSEPPVWEGKLMVPVTLALICFLRQFGEFQP